MDSESSDTAPVEVRHLVQQWKRLDEVLAGLKKDDWTAATALPGWTAVSYTHLTLPTNREV